MMTKGSPFHLVLTNPGFAIISHVLTYPGCKKSHSPSFDTNNRAYDTTNLTSTYWEIPNLSKPLTQDRLPVWESVG